MRDWGDLANDIVISHFVIILERRNRRQGNLFVNHLFWPCFNIYSIHYTLDMCVCLIIENILKNTLSSNSIYLIIAHSIDLTWFKHRITNSQTWQQQKENNLLASIFFRCVFVDLNFVSSRKKTHVKNSATLGHSHI